MGAEVTSFHAIEIKSTVEKLDMYLEKLHKYDHILFTSVNAVNIFFDYLIEKEYDIRNIKAKISAVGKATWQALNRRGIVCFCKAREFMGIGLFKELKPYLEENQKILIPCSSLSKPDLYNQLLNENTQVDRVFIYDTVCGKIRDTRPFEEVDVVFFTSPSTVYNMIDAVGIDAIKEKHVIAIGPKTNKPLRENGIIADVCREHSEEGFLNEIIDLLR